MKTISELSGTISEQSQPPTDGASFDNTQSNEIFFRRLNHFKDRIVFISSSGGAATIMISDLWKIAESADENLKFPIAEKPKQS